MSEPISLDIDVARQAANEWRDYGDEVAKHGQRQHMSLDDLRATVGDTYAPYIEAKQAELDARRAAYERTSAQAHGHADRLTATAANFQNADDESAATIRGLVIDGPESVGTQGFRLASNDTVTDEEARLNAENMERIAKANLPGAGMQF